MSHNSNALALFVALGKVLSLAMGFIVPVVLVRVLERSDYGLYSQFNMLVLSVATFFGFGFRTNLVFFYNKVEKELIRPALVHTVLIVALLGMLAALFVNTAFFQENFLGENEGLLAVIDLLALAVIFQMIASITETLYVVKRDKITGLIYPSFSVVVRALMVVYAAYYVGTFGAAAQALVAALLVLLFFSICYIYFEIKRNPSIKSTQVGLIKQQVDYIAPFGLANSIKELSAKFDKYLALSFLSPTAYAGYSVAFTSVPGVMAAYDSLASVYLMDMVREYKNGNKKGVVDIYKILVTKSFSFSIPLLVLFIYYADVVIPYVFTEKYRDSVVLFQIYLPCLLLFVMGSDLAIRASGRTSLSLRAQAMSLCLSVPVTYFLVANYGTKGAVVGAVIAAVLPIALLLSYSIRLLESSFIEILPWKKIFSIGAITGVAFIPTYLLSFLLGKSIEVFLLCSIVSGVMVLLLEYRYDLMFVDKKNLEKYMRASPGIRK